jgi:hypothetical protein
MYGDSDVETITKSMITVATKAKPDDDIDLIRSNLSEHLS